MLALARLYDTFHLHAVDIGAGKGALVDDFGYIGSGCRDRRCEFRELARPVSHVDLES